MILANCSMYSDAPNLLPQTFYLRDMATGSQDAILGLTLSHQSAVCPCRCLWKGLMGNSRAVRLISTSALSEVGSRRRVRSLPLPPLVCHTGVLRRCLVEVVRHPRVPAGLDLGSVDQENLQGQHFGPASFSSSIHPQSSTGRVDIRIRVLAHVLHPSCP